MKPEELNEVIEELETFPTSKREILLELIQPFEKKIIELEKEVERLKKQVEYYKFEH